MAWTYEQKQYLLDNAGYMPIKDIAKALGKNKYCVYQMFNKLGGTLQTFTWSKREENFLINNWNKYTVNEIALKLGRTSDAVRSKATRLGLQMRVREYRLQEVAELLGTSRERIKYYATKGYLRTFKVGKGKNSHRLTNENHIKNFLYNHQDKWCTVKGFLALDLYERKPRWLAEKIEREKLSNGLKHNQNWSNEEDKLLCELYPQASRYSIEDIANILSRTERSIIWRARILYLDRDNDY